MSLILVDMDGTIADWGSGYNQMLDWAGEDATNIPRHKDQRSFNLNEGLTKFEQDIVANAMASMRYSTLPVIPGAVKALRSMENAGHDVLICTSPWLPNKFCAQDKLDWVAAKLGRHWSERVVITKDKTLVYGDFLVDDKPTITGRITPSWQHVMYTQPYNRDIDTSYRLNTWADWKNEEYV